MSKDDGGFVYPQIEGRQISEYCRENGITEGITRRDWLAGLAMQGLIGKLEKTNTADQFNQWEAIPHMAYNMADLVIAEGRKE